MKTKNINKTGPKTHSELAKALAVSRQLVTAAAAKPDAPPIGDIEKWKIYLAAEGRSGSLPPDLRRAIGQQRLRILEETRKALERENQIKSGEVTHNDEIIRGLNQIGNAFFGTIKQVFAEAPRELHGATPGEILVWGNESYARICKMVEAEFDRMRKTEPKTE